MRHAPLMLLAACMLTASFSCSPSSGLSERDRAFIARRVERLRTELSLTDSQTARVREILTEARVRARKDRERYGRDRAALRRAAMMRMRWVDEQIEAILTDEQRQKYEQLKQEERERFRERRGGFPGPPPGGGPPPPP